VEDALRACNGAVNPDEGCVPLHETYGGPDTIITAPHCEFDKTEACITDADCGASGGRCGYQP